MSRVRAIYSALLKGVRTSEWARWGKYRSYVDGHIQRTNFPGFKFEAWRKDTAEYGRWKALYSAGVRRETKENAERFGRWWWKLPRHYQVGSAIGLTMVSAFGLDVSTSIIHAGKRLIFSGRSPEYVENAYNRMEGLVHSSELRSQMRESTTDFGSGWQHGTTLKWLRSILSDGFIKAKISGHASHVGKAVWFERIAKEQVGYWPGRLSSLTSPRPRGVVFEFPSYIEKTVGAELHTAKGVLRIHKDIPIRMANKVIVPSHERLWQRMFENAGLGHIKVERVKQEVVDVSVDLVESTAYLGARVIKPKFTPPEVAISRPGTVAGKRYDEVKAGLSGVSAAQRKLSLENTAKQRARRVAKIVPHNKRNLTLEMHDRKINRNIIDDNGKNSHLFNS